MHVIMRLQSLTDIRYVELFTIERKAIGDERTLL